MPTGISESIVPLRRSAIGHVELSWQVCRLSSVEFGRKESVWVFGLVEMLHCSVSFDLQKIKKLLNCSSIKKTPCFIVIYLGVMSKIRSIYSHELIRCRTKAAKKKVKKRSQLLISCAVLKESATDYKSVSLVRQFGIFSCLLFMHSR